MKIYNSITVCKTNHEPITARNNRVSFANLLLAVDVIFVVVGIYIILEVD